MDLRCRKITRYYHSQDCKNSEACCIFNNKFKDQVSSVNKLGCCIPEKGNSIHVMGVLD